MGSGGKLSFGKLTLIYAGNGRGKTTLTAVLRSLATNSPKVIAQRKRFDTSEEPYALIATSDSKKPIKFKNNIWSMTNSNIMIFDDTFIEENVYSGLTISPHQRQGLHDVILGAEAVQFKNKLDQEIEVVKDYTKEITTLRKALEPNIPDGLSLDRFCSLVHTDDIDQEIILAEQNLKAASASQIISELPQFQTIELPKFGLVSIEALLNESLDTLSVEAVQRVEQHFATLAGDGERWIAEGMSYAPKAGDSNCPCPFCGQDLSGSTLIEHYRSYFSKSYSKLRDRIVSLQDSLERTFGPEFDAQMQRKLRDTLDLQRRWSKFLSIELDPPNADLIFEDCKLALNGIQPILKAKQASPLESISITERDREAITNFEKHVESLEIFNNQVISVNCQIESLKASIASSSVEDLTRKLNLLNATKIRYQPQIAKLCSKYLKMNEEKSKAEQRRDTLRSQLEKYRDEIFPRFGNKVNAVLNRLGAEYVIQKLQPVNLGTGSSSTYGAKIGDTTINFSAKKSESKPSFGTVLSAGDRTTLAFAFFVASVDEIASLENTTVVFDDPVSSLDAGRNLRTAQEIRGLVGRANQVIVLSHNKEFLCNTARHIDKSEIAPVRIKRIENGSDLEGWNLTKESLTEHDARDHMFRQYLKDGTGDKVLIAKSLRNHLESYFRVTCPQHLRPNGSLGGDFLKRCRCLADGDDQILATDRLAELQNILDFGHPFHHGTPPSWKSQSIDDDELRTFVEMTLRFTAP